MHSIILLKLKLIEAGRRVTTLVQTQGQAAKATNSGAADIAEDAEDGFALKDATELDLTEVKGKIFKRLNETISLNDYRLPTHLYRADLIPLDIFAYNPAERTGMLEAAAMDLSFTHGYPAIDDINPVWDRLPCEPPEAFDAFLRYLELPESTNAENPVRFLPLIAALTQIPLAKLAGYCHVFYWHWRSHAYDLFQVACMKKQRERRIMTVEGHHFALAESMLSNIVKLTSRKLELEMADAAAAESSDEVETKLKDLVDITAKLVGIQRISVGLPSGGPSKLDIEIDSRRHEQVGDVYKAIAKDATHEQVTARRSSDMDALLQDPTNLAQIQDMMIRLSRPALANPNGSGSSQVSARPYDGEITIDIHGQASDDNEIDPVDGLGFELAPGVRIKPTKVEEEHVHNHYLGPETEDDRDD